MRVLMLSSNHSGGGKDYTAAYLRDVIAPAWSMDPLKSFKVNVHPIAAEMKRSAFKAFSTYGVMPPAWYDADRSRRTAIIEGLGMDVVELWIKYGEAMRVICPGVWVDVVTRQLQSVQSLYTTPVLAVIPDVRFDNEILAIRKAFPDAAHWHITSTIGTQRGSDNLISPHLLREAVGLSNNGDALFNNAIRDASYSLILELLNGKSPVRS